MSAAPISLETQETCEEQLALETPVPTAFTPPSIDFARIVAGESYTYHSPVPAVLRGSVGGKADDVGEVNGVDDVHGADGVDGSESLGVECCLGVDEAGRGPVLGPMVYGLLYLPLSQHRSLLAEMHGFDDSKALTPAVRSALFEKLCTSSTDLFANCGWATRVMSARDISSAMFRPAVYNLNAQAMDATIALIREVLEKGVNVREIYIDTIGRPDVYQRKLEAVFPGRVITVAKKADSLYPCVSAASVAAKVTRDVALEVGYACLNGEVSEEKVPDLTTGASAEGWGSGYPSDARCVNWLKGNVDPVFGWGHECRFSWGTAKEMLERKDMAVGVQWPDDGGSGEQGMSSLSEYWWSKSVGEECAGWWGTNVSEVVL